jgi:hypothetical protein
MRAAVVLASFPCPQPSPCYERGPADRELFGRIIALVEGRRRGSEPHVLPPAVAALLFLRMPQSVIRARVSWVCGRRRSWSSPPR